MCVRLSRILRQRERLQAQQQQHEREQCAQEEGRLVAEEEHPAGHAAEDGTEASSGEGASAGHRRLGRCLVAGAGGRVGPSKAAASTAAQGKRCKQEGGNKRVRPRRRTLPMIQARPLGTDWIPAAVIIPTRLAAACLLEDEK